VTADWSYEEFLYAVDRLESVRLSTDHLELLPLYKELLRERKRETAQSVEQTHARTAAENQLAELRAANRSLSAQVKLLTPAPLWQRIALGLLTHVVTGAIGWIFAKL
jgi:hypothetical protein